MAACSKEDEVLGTVQLVHKRLGHQHVYTSPELRGLHVAADSHADAQRKVIAVVHAIAAELGEDPPVVHFVELSNAA